MLGYFRLIDLDDVIKLIMSLPDKQCASDPMPTWLLKTCASDLVPFLHHLFNAGMFPSSFKSAYVTLILKTPGLAEDDAQNYRPTASSSVISKLLEQLVASQPLSYLNCNNLLPENQ